MAGKLKPFMTMKLQIVLITISLLTLFQECYILLLKCKQYTGEYSFPLNPQQKTVDYKLTALIFLKFLVPDN